MGKHGAVVGAGQANIAAKRWRNFGYNLDMHLRSKGNVVGLIGKVNFFKTNAGEIREATMLEPYSSPHGRTYIISFPTKEHFKNPAIPELIVKSAKELVTICDNLNFKKVVMGRPGCGKYTGRLSYATDVKPLIQNILNDRFIIVNKE